MHMFDGESCALCGMLAIEARANPFVTCEDYTWQEALKDAREMGREAGQNAASWVFDGNTDLATYARVLRGLEDGDPAILDSLSFPSLSGEWADEFNSNDLYKEVGISPDEDDSGEICRAWEDASSEAFLHEIERLARVQLQPDSTCGHCGHQWNSALTPTPSARCPNEYDHEYPEDS